MLTIQLFIRELDGLLTRIYAESKELWNFLKKTEVKNFDGIRQYVEDNGDDCVITPDNSANGITCKNISFCLHVPYEKNGYVLSFSVIENNLTMFAYHHEL